MPVPPTPGQGRRLAATCARCLVQGCNLPPPPPQPPPQPPASCLPAGAHIYGGVDWVAMAMSADETAGDHAGARRSPPCCHSAQGNVSALFLRACLRELPRGPGEPATPAQPLAQRLEARARPLHLPPLPDSACCLHRRQAGLCGPTRQARIMRTARPAPCARPPTPRRAGPAPCRPAGPRRLDALPRRGQPRQPVQ